MRIWVRRSGKERENEGSLGFYVQLGKIDGYRTGTEFVEEEEEDGRDLGVWILIKNGEKRERFREKTRAENEGRLKGRELGSDIDVEGSAY